MLDSLGVAGFLLWVVLAIVSLPILGLAVVRIAQTHADATLTATTEARHTYRRWVFIATLSSILFVGAGALAVFIYVSCVGEC